MLDVRNGDVEGQIGCVGGNIAKMRYLALGSVLSLNNFSNMGMILLWKYGVEVLRTFITIKSSRSE